MTRFELVEPSLEALFIEHVGRPADDDATLAPAVAAPSAAARGRRLMARRDPLLPNAGIVARREYRDRTRSPLFIVSTIVLDVLALLVALAPIAIRYLDRQTVTRIAVVSPTRSSAAGRRRRRQPAQHPARRRRDPATWKRPSPVEIAADGPGRCRS